jgi:hypothetical protein
MKRQIAAQARTGARKEPVVPFTRNRKGNLMLRACGFPVTIRPLKKTTAESDLLQKSSFYKGMRTMLEDAFNKLDYEVKDRPPVFNSDERKQYTTFLMLDAKEGKRDAVLAEAKVDGRPVVVGIYDYRIDKKNKKIKEAFIALDPAFQNERLGFAMALERERIMQRKYPGYLIEVLSNPKSEAIYRDLGYAGGRQIDKTGPEKKWVRVVYKQSLFGRLKGFIFGK